jgi:DNA-binding NarL/FixJ family response regulator
MTELKIMIVDGNPRMRYLYRRFLEKSEHSVVIEAETASDAIRQFKKRCGNGQERPGVLVADARLPDGNRVEVAKKLLRIDPNLKAILLTSDSLSEPALRRMGIKRLLNKPFPMQELIEAISSVSDGGFIEE